MSPSYKASAGVSSSNIQKLIIVRGLPGSGKSTYARKLVDLHRDYQHLEADMYFVNNAGHYCFDPQHLPQAHDWCQQQARLALLEGKTVVVSNTFVRLWEMKSYLDLAEQLKLRVEIVEAKGEFESIHDVPVSTIAKMAQRWQTVPNRWLQRYSIEEYRPSQSSRLI